MNNAVQDPTLQVSLLQQCLSGGKKQIGLFLGAGCPMAIRDENQDPLIPAIAGITERVRTQLIASTEPAGPYGIAEDNLKEDGYIQPTVEDLLTHIRALGAVAGNDTVRGLSAEQLDKLDEQICNLIHETINRELPHNETPYHSVAMWANAIPRESPVEIFTTNYDMLLEQALEESRVPYFDGFSGARRPFFNPHDIEEDALLPHWTRLWKLHGSINWYQNDDREVFRGTINETGRRRVIHPSHLKYQESRRMPYLAMIDRLRTFFNNPTAALVLCGYSFRDDHINDTIIQGLQHTQTTVAFALLFGDIEDYPNVEPLTRNRPNLNVLARDGGIIGSQRVDWSERDPEEAKPTKSQAVTWQSIDSKDDHSKQRAEFNLGDFQVFGQFLQQLVGDGQRPRDGASNAQ